MAVGVFTAVLNVLMITPIIYMLQVYDRVLASLNVTTLVMLTLIALGLYVLMGLLEAVRGKTLIRFGNQLDAQLNDRIFRATYQSYLREGNGNAQQALSDFNQIRQFLTGQGIISFFNAPWTVVFLAIIFLVHWALGCLVLAGAIVLIALAFINEWATNEPLSEANQLRIRANAQAASNLRNAEVIEAMGMIAHVRQRWLARHHDMLDHQTLASERAVVISSATHAIRIALQSLTLGLGAWLFIQNQLGAGMMIAASLLSGRALSPIEGLIGQWKNFVAARRAHDRIRQLLHTYPADTPSLPLPAPKGELRIEALYGGPPGSSKPIVGNIQFSLPRGEALGIIGPSASGKSTLSRLLVGIWKPLSGNVRLDGADIFEWNKEELGPHIGYLPQDIELFEGSVAENIARFGPLDSHSIVSAAQEAGVHDLILRLPEGYQTEIGAGGVKLSGGQRQRIALARALYKKPSLVVLDEPNSNLDDQGENALIHAINAIKARHATAIIITHRQSVLAAADKLLFLKEGAVVQFGPRDQVLAALRGHTATPSPAVRKPGGPRIPASTAKTTSPPASIQ